MFLWLFSSVSLTLMGTIVSKMPEHLHPEHTKLVYNTTLLTPVYIDNKGQNHLLVAFTVLIKMIMDLHQLPLNCINKQTSLEQIATEYDPQLFQLNKFHNLNAPNQSICLCIPTNVRTNLISLQIYSKSRCFHCHYLK